MNTETCKYFHFGHQKNKQQTTKTFLLFRRLSFLSLKKFWRCFFVVNGFLQIKNHLAYPTQNASLKKKIFESLVLGFLLHSTEKLRSDL
jgi:hypothetical protein